MPSSRTARPAQAKGSTPAKADLQTKPLPCDDTYLTPEELAHLLGVPVKTLAHWRTARTGPLFIRVGVYVRYPKNLFNEWYAEREREAREWMNS